MAQPPHCDIIAKGPPEGCLEGMKTTSHVLPKSPFIVYYSNGSTIEGERARLSIESDAFWLETDSGEQDRVFFAEVETFTCIDLPGYADQYLAIVVRSGGCFRTFYFIPKQYKQILEEICHQ
jgi:hypothetical protein